MGLTDEELAAKRQHVADLTAQLEAAKAENSVTLREKENEIEGARLDAAAVNLEAQLAAVMAAGSQERIDAANEPVLAQADREMTQAVEFHEARVASEEAQAKAAQDAIDNPVNPEDIGVAPDEIERRKLEREAAEKDEEPEVVTPPSEPPTPTLPPYSAPSTPATSSQPTDTKTADNKTEGGNS